MTEFTGNPLLVVIVTISIAWGVWEWYKTDRRTPEQQMLAWPRKEAERIRRGTSEFAKRFYYEGGKLQEETAQTRAKKLADRVKQKADRVKQKADRKGRR